MQVITRKEAQAQGLKRYYTGEPCKHGHLSERLTSNRRCVCCAQAASADWMIKNAEKRYEQRKSYRVAYKAKNRDFILKQQRLYTQSLAFKQKRHIRRHEDLQFKMRERLRIRLWTALKRGQGWKYESATELLGCSIKQLVEHLECQFQDGMAWSNWAHDGWHIDHIRPCASFDLTDPEHQKECFHYTNLQPLWAEDNLTKKDKWEAA